MGSNGPAGTLSTNEAAKILKVDPRTLRRMVRQGLVRPAAKGPDHLLRFHAADVHAASRLRGTTVEPHRISTIARQALALAEATERRLEELYTLLGIGYVVLPTDSHAVANMYNEAAKLLECDAPEPTVEEVQYWARLFLAVTPAYLRLVEDAVGEQDAWHVLVELAAKLCERAPVATFRFHKELESAYGFLEAGRRNVFSTAFFFTRNRHGRDVAVELFPDGRKTLDEAVLAFLSRV